MAAPFRALVIDDDRDLLNLVRRTLEFTAGWQVSVATSGAAGVAAALDAPPDVIIVDLMMPEMDGYEVCRRLREDARTARVPVVFLTARRDIEEQRLRSVSPAGIVFKPFQPNELAKQVRAFCP